MIKLTKKIDYTFILLSVLGELYMKDKESNSKSNRTRLAMKKFCEENQISLKFIQSIVTQLAQQNIIESKSGVKGGVYLNKDPEEITLLELIELIESPITLMDCLDDSKACIRTGFCPITHVLSEIQEALKNRLKKMTVLDFVLKKEELPIECPILEH